jgi:hypothetical protein
MSHFPVLVILPKDTDEADVEDAATKLLAPYDENTEVDAYEVPCGCVNHVARMAGRKRAEAEVGTIDDLRNSFVPPDDSAAVQSAWKAHLAPFNAAEQRYTAEHPEAGQPIPACDECHGTGKRMTTYNPASKWDYWQIGGRWNGRATEDGSNLFRVSELGRDWSAFAIVTPDGAWHEKGTMGWWAVVTDEKSDWDAERFEIASAYPEHLALYIDCHI